MSDKNEGYTNPEVLSDEDLQAEFYRALDFGPEYRLCEVKDEIVNRWMREKGSGNFA